MASNNEQLRTHSGPAYNLYAKRQLDGFSHYLAGLQRHVTAQTALDRQPQANRLPE